MPAGYVSYTTALTNFIREVRKDLNKPKLPFVTGVMGGGGQTSEYGPAEQRYKAALDHFRAAMAAPADLPEFKGTVTYIRTEKYWNRDLKLARAKAASYI